MPKVKWNASLHGNAVYMIYLGVTGRSYADGVLTRSPHHVWRMVEGTYFSRFIEPIRARPLLLASSLLFISFNSRLGVVVKLVYCGAFALEYI